MIWRIAGANFDQMHMHTNLGWADGHPDAEIVGLCDEHPETSTGSLIESAETYGVPPKQRYDDLHRMLDETDPDIVLGCPMNADHPDFVERVLARDIHTVIEKPYAMSLEDADRMLEAAADSEGRLAVNWPSSWTAETHTVKRLVDEGTIGDIIELQYYGGNAGAPPNDSWFYQADCGGGSMLDYLGYGATFSTWFRGGELPSSIIADAYVPDDMDVDVQSTAVCRFADGLSTFQTSWRMFTHPWEHKPQPNKGYDIVGTDGTLSTRDRKDAIRVQTADDPDGFAVEPDEPPSPYGDLFQYLLDRLEKDKPFEGPTDPTFCREAQRLIETAQRSVNERAEVDLVD